MDTWVEGLGSELGFFGAYLPPPFECNCNLNCAEALEYITNGTLPCGGIYSDIQSPSLSENIFKVFPNPANDKCFITLNCNPSISQQAKIEFINPQGQVIVSKMISIAGGVLQDQIRLDKFPSGIYMIKVKSEIAVFGQLILVIK